MDRPGIGVPAWEKRAEQAKVNAYVDYLRDHGGAAPPPGWAPGND